VGESDNHADKALCGQFFREALASGGALVAIDVKTQRMIGSSRFHGYDEERSEVEIGRCPDPVGGGCYNAEMKGLMLQQAFRFVDGVLFPVGPQTCALNGPW
jgi:hypothetical protein